MKSKSYNTPLILIFSTRERIRGILSVGLLQYHYRIIQAINSNVASLKANQFVPDLVIADITANNAKDILMVNRLHHSERTRSTPLLAVVPRTIKEKLEKILNAKADIEGTPDNAQFFLIEYPFNFSDLLKKITHILARFGNPLPQKQNLDEDEQKGTSESSPHKIFIMDVEPQQVPVQGFDDSSMIFINQDNLDMRFILHILDKFYGRVIVPQHTDVGQD